ncbi:MAG: hypothetical protein KDD45_11525, partial [Bdellovibrionales bacterium]|nr:hypothetical protein [Bdellovibrionales bacterium]
RNWLVNKNCLMSGNKGFNISLNEKLNNSPNINSFAVKIVDTKKDEKRRFKTLDDLGVYNELKSILLSLDSKIRTENTVIYLLLKKSLKLIAMGFYEYNKTKKGELFSKARSVVAQALVESQLEVNDFCKTLREVLQSSVLPGLSGLIRKMDMKERPHG